MEAQGLLPSSSCNSAPSFGALTPFCLSQGSVDACLPVQTNHCSDLSWLVLRLFCKPECCFNLNWYFHHRPSLCVGGVKVEHFAQISRCLNSLGTSTQSLIILGYLNLITYTWPKNACHQVPPWDPGLSSHPTWALPKSSQSQNVVRPMLNYDSHYPCA